MPGKQLTSYFSNLPLTAGRVGQIVKTLNMEEDLIDLNDFPEPPAPANRPANRPLRPGELTRTSLSSSS